MLHKNLVHCRVWKKKLEFIKFGRATICATIQMDWFKDEQFIHFATIPWDLKVWAWMGDNSGVTTFPSVTHGRCRISASRICGPNLLDGQCTASHFSDVRLHSELVIPMAFTVPTNGHISGQMRSAGAHRYAMCYIEYVWSRGEAQRGQTKLFSSS